MLQNFEDDGFLPFQPERIQRIDEVEPEFVREIAKHPESLIKVIAHLDDHRAKLQCLRQFRGGDLAEGNKNHGFHTSPRGIGRHGSGSIARRGARGHSAAQDRRLRDAGCHPQILERTRRIVALMLDRQPYTAGPFPGAVHVHQGRAAFREADHVPSCRHERQKIAESPDAALVNNRAAHLSLLP